MFKEWFNKKVAKTVKNVIEPVKEEIKQKTKSKGSFYSVILKIGCAIIIAVLLLRDNSRTARIINGTLQPGTIIINNYIGDKVK